ncbi:down-regulator of transcription 1 [Pancytospora epiphaga]|nr:down-regulator of transcription 1 [Pancytospora epiphaga]
MLHTKPDEETSLPRATVDKLIHKSLKKPYIISKEMKGFLREACQLFLNIVILEANRVCEADSKKIIANSHIYKSLEKHGFQEYIQDCQHAASDYDDYAKHKPSKQNKFKESGKTMDELHEDQMRLFQKAKMEQQVIFGVEEHDESTDE